MGADNGSAVRITLAGIDQARAPGTHGLPAHPTPSCLPPLTTDN